MTRPLSLLALDPHLILLGPPPALLRRDTARIADAHPALPCACSVSAGYGSREATRFCPSHALSETSANDLRTGTPDGQTPQISDDVTNRHGSGPEQPPASPSPAEGETDRAAEEGWEPEGWTEADPYDLLNEPEVWFCPDCGTEERPGKGGWNCATCDRRLIRDDARVEEAPPCARCCGTGQEIAAATGELDSCGDCGGTGLAEPWRDPDYAAHYGICPGCGISTHPTPEAGSCPTCDARLLAALYAEAWGDDPDPGDGGLGLGSWAASVEAELGCPSCGRPTPHLWAGATCAGCLVAGRAA